MVCTFRMMLLPVRVDIQIVPSFIKDIFELLSHMVGHPRCVFINYIWLNQMSNTTNLWWIVVYYLVINYMFRALMAIFRLMN